MNEVKNDRGRGIQRYIQRSQSSKTVPCPNGWRGRQDAQRKDRAPHWRPLPAHGGLNTPWRANLGNAVHQGLCREAGASHRRSAGPRVSQMNQEKRERRLSHGEFKRRRHRRRALFKGPKAKRNARTAQPDNAVRRTCKRAGLKVGAWHRRAYVRRVRARLLASGIHVCPKPVDGGPMARFGKTVDIVRCRCAADGQADGIGPPAAMGASRSPTADLSGNEYGQGRELFAHFPPTQLARPIPAPSSI